MEPTELRIGNFIQYNSPDHSIWFDLVVGINYSDDFHVHMVELHGRTPININGISPIPITPEWLERLGFELHKPCGDEGFIKWKHKNGVYLLWIEGKFWHDHWSTGIWINSVHQLQNLYHALTGQELTVKELTPSIS